MESRGRAQRANGDCLCCKRVGVLQCLCYKHSSSPITVKMTTRQLNVKVLLLLLLLLPPPPPLLLLPSPQPQHVTHRDLKAFGGTDAESRWRWGQVPEFRFQVPRSFSFKFRSFSFSGGCAAGGPPTA